MKKLFKFEFIRTFTAIAIALLIAFAVIMIVSEEPMEATRYFLAGPLTKQRYLGNVLEAAIPLMFSGIATALLFQTGLFNMGAEGVFYISGLTAAIIGITSSLPGLLHSALAIFAGAVVGAFVMLIIGVFKAKWNVSELVLSLMFNNILYGVGLYILNHHFRDIESVSLRSHKMQPSVLLQNLIPGTRIHTGLVIGLAVLILVHFFLYRTKWGYSVRMTGMNPIFAKYSGMSVPKTILMSSLLAGFIAGMGGSVEVLGMYESFTWAALPGLGFDGALIATLAKNKPINVLYSALFLAYIRVGADLMSRMTDVPSEMVGIIQGIIILLISGQKFLQYYKRRKLEKEATDYAVSAG